MRQYEVQRFTVRFSQPTGLWTTMSRTASTSSRDAAVGQRARIQDVKCREPPHFRPERDRESQRALAHVARVPRALPDLICEVLRTYGALTEKMSQTLVRQTIGFVCPALRVPGRAEPVQR